jgi:hypothetical protein
MSKTRLEMADGGEIAEWVGLRIPHVGADGFGACQGIWVRSERRTLAGVVFHEWQPGHRNIQLSMAADSPLWARRDLIAGILAYPFRQLDAWMVYTMTPEDNLRALRVNERIGFDGPVLISHWFGRNRHGIIRRMLRPDYEYIYGCGHIEEGIEHGKESPEASCAA